MNKKKGFFFRQIKVEQSDSQEICHARQVRALLQAGGR